jgi:hypothetical protein
VKKEPNWTNARTKRVAMAMLKACQPVSRARQPPIDWEQVIAFLETQRDEAIGKRDKARKGKRP